MELIVDFLTGANYIDVNETVAPYKDKKGKWHTEKRTAIYSNGDLFETAKKYEEPCKVIFTTLHKT